MPVASWDPFEALSTEQRDRLATFQAELVRFNRRLNLISRDTEASFVERHLRHVLALTCRSFPAGSTLVDWGTGGGLPAIPMAVCCPNVTVHAVDAVGKKVQAVQVMARRLGLKNLHAWHCRAEEWPGTAQYSVSRATAPLADLWGWHRRVFRPGARELEPGDWRPGLLCLKGGDLEEEQAALRTAYPTVHVETMALDALLGGGGFANKAILAVTET